MMFVRQRQVKGRILAGMAKEENLKWPVDVGHDYVDFTESTKRLITTVEAAGPGETFHPAKHFRYRGFDFIIQFMDGCFYPFVFEAKQLQ